MQRILRGFLVAGLLAAATGCQESASIVGVIARNERGVTSIAVDEGFVYWAKGDGTIKRFNLDTGELRTLGEVDGPVDNLTIDRSHVFASTGGALLKVAKSGGAMEQFTLTAAAQALSLDDDHLYLASSAGTVDQHTKDGAFLQTLATSENPRAVLAGTSTVFWGSSVPQGAVMQVPVQGGTVTPILPNEDAPVALTMDIAHLLWANAGDGQSGTINTSALDGSDKRVLASGQQQLHAVMTDSTYVYWSNLVGEVHTVSSAGGDPYPLITGPLGRVSIAMDVTSVYWANSADGAILTMSKL